jgi:hypothetical protein
MPEQDVEPVVAEAQVAEVSLTDAQADAIPVAAAIVAGNERTSCWYYSQFRDISNNDPDCDQKRITLSIMGTHKRLLEETEDIMLILEQIFNSSHTAQKKRCLSVHINNAFNERMQKKYTCTCDHDDD